MSEQSNDHREIPIKISVSVEQPDIQPSSEKSDNQPTESAGLKDGAVLLKHCNIVFALAERQTEHGLTKIQVVQFADPDQRQKILRLFNNPTLYSKLPQLYTYFTSLKNGEQLYYAAVTVSELVNVIPFVELKEGILLFWARSEMANQREAAALALCHMAEQETLQAEVLNLLKHWLTINNLTFNNTALRAYRLIGQSHPGPTLTAIRDAVITKNKILVVEARSILDVLNQVSTTVQVWQMIEKIVYIVDKIYSLHPHIVTTHLHSWLTSSSSQQKVEQELLRYMAAMLFSVIIRLENLARREEEFTEDMYSKIVDIIFTLWDDSSMPMHDDIHDDTTQLVKSWAEQTLQICAEDKEDCKGYTQLFYALYHRYKNHRINRLDFYLRRWQRFHEMERQRSERKMEMARRHAEKLGKPIPQSELDLRGDFLDLIPAN